jgi:hypothetical protein
MARIARFEASRDSPSYLYRDTESDNDNDGDEDEDG